MVAVINYKDRPRVVYVLGKSSGKIYCLSSNKIDAPTASGLSQILDNIKGLDERLIVLKEIFPSLYNSALRVFEESSISIVKTYERSDSKS